MPALIWICLALVAGAALAIVGIGWYLKRQVTHPRLWSLAQTEQFERDAGLLGPYERAERRPFAFTGSDGYVLHGEILPCNDSNRYVILSHGFSYTRHGSIKYAWMFLHMGFNVVVYDMRHHGENKRCRVTMGRDESDDLCRLVAHIRSMAGKHALIGLHGESMGASTSIMALPKLALQDPDTAFCIADCGYSDLIALLRHKLETNYPWLPSWMVSVADWICLIREGFRFSSIRPIDALAHTTVPLLFVHGRQDAFTPCRMSMHMHEQARGYKELHLIELADHAKSFAVDPVAYETLVQRFLIASGVEISCTPCPDEPHAVAASPEH